jgi:hypothetical protein
MFPAKRCEADVMMNVSRLDPNRAPADAGLAAIELPHILVSVQSFASDDR